MMFWRPCNPFVRRHLPDSTKGGQDVPVTRVHARLTYLHAKKCRCPLTRSGLRV